MPPKFKKCYQDEQFRKGMDQFNARQFFESHESWEHIWLFAAEPDKRFLQGIIQVAAAFHHYQQANHAGARSLLRQGLRKLERYPPDYRGLRLEELRAACRYWIGALDSGQSPALEEFPRLQEAT